MGGFQILGEMEDNRGKGKKRRAKMGQSRREMKAVMMKAAEETVDQLLDWHEGTAAPDLTQMEEVVLRLRQALSEKLSETILANQGTVRPIPGPVCEGCGREMRYKGQYGKRVSSWVGELKIERGYFYCEGCRGGLFPPG
jgi:hypothetical protein